MDSPIDSPALNETPNLLKRESSYFGGKNIGFWGSLFLIVNNAVGPAILIFPLLNQTSGFLPPALFMGLVWIISTLSCTMLCEVIQKIPDNESFQQRIEFCDAVKHYMGERWFVISHVLLFLSLQASNIAAMIVSSQVVDNFLIKCVGQSYALDYSKLEWVTTGEERFEGHHIISLGFLINLIICIPFGYVSLEDNIWFQNLSFVCLIVFTAEFYVQFVLNMEDHTRNVEPVEYDLAAITLVLGTVIFCDAFVVTLPSWLNEKKEDVNVNLVVWMSTFFATIMCVSFGVCGALSYSLTDSNNKPIRNSDNMLNLLVKSDNLEITQYSSFLWNITTLIPGIPVLAVVMKYNLVSGDILGERMGFLLAVVLPWVLTAVLYEASILARICAIAGLLIQGYINFVIPVYLYILSIDTEYESDPFLLPHEITGGEEMIHALPKSFSNKTKRIISWSILIFFMILTTFSIVYTIYDMITSAI